jgi:maltooligosyltrehalose trehalohydrolase
VDGLRLDATHAIVDDSEVHILQEIARAMHALSPPRVVIAEDERNERRLVLRESEGGFGLDAVWADDLHHQLRRLTAGDSEGYFADYAGTLGAVAETLRRAGSTRAYPPRRQASRHTRGPTFPGGLRALHSEPRSGGEPGAR